MRSIAELSNLAGRRAIVTGGAGHIGSAAAEALAELGASVCIVDRDQSRCDATASRLADAYGGQHFGAQCNLLDETSTREMVRGQIDRFGGLEILIHCAAYIGATDVPGWAVPFEEQTVGAWDEAVRVNMTAGFVMAQEAQKALSVSGHGSLILFSSIYGLVAPNMDLYDGTAMANPLGYGASKAGVLNLARYLASLFAPQTRVNCISPGGVVRGQPESFREKYENRAPLKRMAVEEDLKGAVAYLASDLSAYVTGQNLQVDGGWTIW